MLLIPSEEVEERPLNVRGWEELHPICNTKIEIIVEGIKAELVINWLVDESIQCKVHEGFWHAVKASR